MKKKTANLYIDGYNFYYAITKNTKKNPKDINDRVAGHAWCNFKKLAEKQLLQPDEQLGKVVYCTADVGIFGKGEEEEKQKLWLSYLEEYIRDDLLTIVRGHHSKYENPPKKEYIEKELKKLSGKIDIVLQEINQETADTKNTLETLTNQLRRFSDKVNPKRKEKMTDVNMAVEMVMDGLCRRNMDIAILITEDIDYFRAVKYLCKKIDVQVWIPPKESRHSESPEKKESSWESPWEKKKKEYDLDLLTVHKLTLKMLASSTLPYQKKDNKETCSAEKFLLKSIRKDIYKDEDNRYWTYDAIKESVNEVQKISVVDDIVCNVTANEKERLKENAGWKQFEEQGISVYDYLEGEYKT